MSIPRQRTEPSLEPAARDACFMTGTSLTLSLITRWSDEDETDPKESARAAPAPVPSPPSTSTPSLSPEDQKMLDMISARVDNARHLRDHLQRKMLEMEAARALQEREDAALADSARRARLAREQAEAEARGRLQGALAKLRGMTRSDFGFARHLKQPPVVLKVRPGRGSVWAVRVVWVARAYHTGRKGMV